MSLSLSKLLPAAWARQFAGERVLDATLSGLIGTAVMVPVAHLVARAIGLIGITEIVGENADTGSENFLSALVSVPSIALGILVGTTFVRAANALGAGSRSPG